jgi:hypothetical protein
MLPLHYRRFSSQQFALRNTTCFFRVHWLVSLGRGQGFGKGVSRLPALEETNRESVPSPHHGPARIRVLLLHYWVSLCHHRLDAGIGVVWRTNVLSYGLLYLYLPVNQGNSKLQIQHSQISPPRKKLRLTMSSTNFVGIRRHCATSGPGDASAARFTSNQVRKCSLKDSPPDFGRTALWRAAKEPCLRTRHHSISPCLAANCEPSISSSNEVAPLLNIVMNQA